MKRRKEGERPAWLNADGSYTLLVPIEYSQGDTSMRLDQLQLRRLRATEMLILDEPLLFTEKLLRVIEVQTGLLRKITGMLDAADLDRVDDILGYFREPGSITGAIS